MRRETQIALSAVERTARLLGHELTDWTQDEHRRYSAKCERCGAVVNAKVGLRTSDLSDEQCKGRAL